MRLIVMLAPALLVMNAAAPDASAQRAAQALPPALSEYARPTPQRSVRFRARSVEERIAAIRRLDANARQRVARGEPATLAPSAAQLSDSFVLTPRDPFIAGQGVLRAHGVSFNPSADPSGEIRFLDSDPGSTTTPSFSLALHASAGQRLLVECTIEGQSEPLHGNLFRAGGVNIWQASVSPYENVVSFLTPPLAGDTPSEVFFGIVPSNPHPSAYGWMLYGCQITRLTLP